VTDLQLLLEIVRKLAAKLDRDDPDIQRLIDQLDYQLHYQGDEE